MNKPVIGTALPIAGTILIAWSLLAGTPDDSSYQWLLRTLITYPACHLAVRTYRHRT